VSAAAPCSETDPDSNSAKSTNLSLAFLLTSAHLPFSAVGWLRADAAQPAIGTTGVEDRGRIYG
jgi:hypothetical protein